MREIKKITLDEFDKSLELSQYAFQYSLSEESKQKRRESFHLHDVWGEFEGDTLTSKLHLYPLSVFIGKAEVKMGGVAGVATWPEYRRGGSVARLIDHALKTMKEKGQVLSFLHPFDIEYYRRFGWELCFSHKKYTIEKSDLQFMPGVPGTIKRLSVQKDLEIINTIYEQFAQNYNGMLKRDRNWWENHVYSEGYQFAVFFNEDLRPTGYLFYKVSDKLLDVQEFFYLNGESRRGLWNFICQHDSMVEKVKIIVPENEQLHYLLKNPKVKIDVEPYFMARIVDVVGFLQQYTFNKVDERLLLHVKDDKADWNNQSLVIENGEVVVGNAEEEGITLTIKELTAIILQAQTAQFLYEADMIKGTVKKVQLLDQMIPKRSASIIDFF
ncbi:GNAT family N-acetyltransferase [Bacillus suaedaesalsae]|uniref:GNAT family N-acetyltransferase n=1 Tax=Bacillus suaedaesalsae TaxID=2810349 RepID=A0ABS2DEF6_9BACI|nr:GNAT family N-acetyltransferase [Bacillus suaedaesalsae]MBM6616847.1 GNAT family N-acetyltransferase [Bacillus suaedaesalsae]